MKQIRKYVQAPLTAISQLHEAGKEFSDLPWEESEDMKEICDNFRIIERQRDLYRERCTRLQKENENLKRLLDKIQIVVCQYSNC